MEYAELKRMLCKELDMIVDKGELSAGDLDVVDKLTHSLKSLSTIEAMDDYSGDYDGSNSGYMRYGRDYSGRDYSYAQRRDSRGRYMTSGRRYSRDSEELVSGLERMMDGASDKEREVIRRAITELKR